MRPLQTLLALGRRLEDGAEAALARRYALPAAVSSITAAVFLLRLGVALQHPSAGPDYGHYLIAANWYAGNDRSGEGPFDPPVIPLLVLALSAAVGKLAALQILGPLTAALLYPAAVFFLARFVPRPAALLAPLPFVLWQRFNEFIAFGGPTNLLGLALSIVFYRALFEAAASPSAGLRPRRVDLAASALLVAIVSTHHLTALVVGTTTLLWLALQLALQPPARRALFFTGARLVGVALLGSLPYASYLLGLASTDTQGGFGQPFPLDTLGDLFGVVWRETPWLWLAFLGLALLAFVRLGRTSALLPAATAILATPALLLVTVLASHPFRILFFEQFPLVAFAALWSVRGPTVELPRLLRPDGAVAARALWVALVVVSVPVLAAAAGPQQEVADEHYHQFLIPGTIEAFDWVAEHTPANAVVALDADTAPEYNQQWKGMALGWWLSGYANRKTLYEANPILISNGWKWDDVRDANRLFAGETAFEDGILRVTDTGWQDDTGVPRIHVGYLQDYRELIGFENPRLLNRTTGAAFTLQLGAAPDLQRELVGDSGRVDANYTGPGFQATRSLRYSSSNHTVDARFDVTTNGSAGWDEFEITVRIPWWTEVNLSALESGSARVGVPDSFGYVLEKAMLNFSRAGLEGARLVAPYALPFEPAVGLRWNATGPSFSVEARFVLTQAPESHPDIHALSMRTADEILREKGVGFLFVAKNAPADIQRFVRSPERFERVFENQAAAIFRVLPAA